MVNGRENRQAEAATAAAEEKFIHSFRIELNQSELNWIEMLMRHGMV